MSKYGREERRSHGGGEEGDSRGSRGGRRNGCYEGGRDNSRRDSFVEDGKDEKEGRSVRRRDDSFEGGRDNSRRDSLSEDGRDDQRGRPVCRRENSRDRSSSNGGQGFERRRRSSSYSRDNEDKKNVQVQEAPLPGSWELVEDNILPSWIPESLLQEPRPDGWIAPTPTPVPLAVKPFADLFENEIKQPSRFDKDGKLDDKETILRENRDIDEREPLVVVNNLCVVRTDLRGIKESKRRREEEDREEEMEFRNSGFHGRGGGRGGRGLRRGGGRGRGGFTRSPAEGGDPNKMPVGERKRFGDEGDCNLLERPSDRIVSGPVRDRKPPSPPRDRRPPSPMERRRPPSPIKELPSYGEDRHAQRAGRPQQSPRDRLPRSNVEDEARPRSPLRGREEIRDSSSNSTSRRSSYGDFRDKYATPGSGSAVKTPVRSQAQPSPAQGRTSSAAGTPGSTSSGPGMTYKEWKERKARAKTAGQ